MTVPIMWRPGPTAIIDTRTSARTSRDPRRDPSNDPVRRARALLRSNAARLQELEDQVEREIGDVLARALADVPS